MGAPGRAAARPELNGDATTNTWLAGRFGWRLRLHAGEMAPQRQNARAIASSGGLLDISLTMSYFHTGTRTIIGAEAFHFPVRDGKEWDHLAMVIRLNWLPGRHGTAKPKYRVESL